MAMDSQVREQYNTYITGCHVLHYHQVVDAYGHLSARSKTDPSLFIMARYLPPALVSAASDIIEYRVSDAQPVDPNAPKGYSERFIHSEMYKKYPEVQSVIHSHSKEIIPFSMTNVALKTCSNTGGFLG